MISNFLKLNLLNGYWRTYLEPRLLPERLLPEWLRLP